MIGTIIAVVLIGLIAGFLGRALLPGRDPMGLGATIVVGILGSLIGWFLFTRLLNIGDEDKFDLGGLPGAIIGTMILLFIYRKVSDRPATAAR